MLAGTVWLRRLVRIRLDRPNPPHPALRTRRVRSAAIPRIMKTRLLLRWLLSGLLRERPHRLPIARASMAPRLRALRAKSLLLEGRCASRRMASLCPRLSSKEASRIGECQAAAHIVNTLDLLGKNALSHCAGRAFVYLCGGVEKM